MRPRGAAICSMPHQAPTVHGGGRWLGFLGNRPSGLPGVARPTWQRRQPRNPGASLDPAAPKTTQLQLRLTRAQKTAIARAARRAGLDMSSYVLDRLLPSVATRFEELVRACTGGDAGRYALAELNDFLSGLGAGELTVAVAPAAALSLPPGRANYVAAMVEYACGRRGMAPPAWTRDIPPLPVPEFGSGLASLRLHLLRHSPPPFRRRNLFIDASLGDRV